MRGETSAPLEIKIERVGIVSSFSFGIIIVGHPLGRLSHPNKYS
jgi:hypothetical protein